MNGLHDTIRELERCFRGLGDPTRLRIVNLLLAGEMCGCDVQSVLGRSQSNVSRHLTYLKHAGLVQDRRCGYRVYYRLTPGPAVARLIPALREAFGSDTILDRDRARLVAAVRRGACTLSEAASAPKAQRAGSLKRPRTRPRVATPRRKSVHA